MKLNRSTLATAALLTASVALPASRPGAAEIAKDTLVIVSEMGPNGLDTMVPTANDHSRMVVWQAYDRLVSHGEKTLADGTISYDAKVVTPELAESWEASEDGKTYIFHLRKDATFHDGTPVTAKDVKWSFDRAIAAGGFPAVQMAAGSLVKPEQFSVVDDHTFKATFDQFNKLTMPDLVVPVPVIVNSELAKKHATEKDPWAFEWVSRNDCGGGAFKVESWTSGQQTVFTRFDEWKSGPLPKLKRVVYRQIASAGTRRALLEKGDVDMSVGLPPKDYAELAEQGKVKVIGVPVQNDLVFVDMNVKIPPFDNPKVREADLLRHPLQGDHQFGALQPRQADVRRRPAQPYPDRDLAGSDQAWPGSGEGQETARRSRLPQRLQDHTVDRSQRIDGARAVRDPDPGGAEDYRCRGHDRESAGLELVRPDGEQDHADGHRRILRLARLPRLLLLLDL